MRLALLTVAALLFGLAAATLAVAGAWSTIGNRPALAGLLGAIVACGTVAPVLTRAFAERARLATLSTQALARHFTDRARESLVKGGRLGLDDVGVHFFVKRRRRIVFWRHEYIRYARSAKPSRAPAPGHATWREGWRDGLADGLVGIAAERTERIRVNLLDHDHLTAGSQEWEEWYENRDPRSLGMPWALSANSRRWFSAIWAEPVPDSSGQVVGVLTVNVEREVPDGDQRLREEGAQELLQNIARDAGQAFHRIHL